MSEPHQFRPIGKLIEGIVARLLSIENDHTPERDDGTVVYLTQRRNKTPARTRVPQLKACGPGLRLCQPR